VFELKPLRAEAIPAALSKAERYRLLHEPEQAQSICQDVLRTQPGNQQAITLYLLSITDCFRTQHPDLRMARALLEQLASEYDRSYYAGIVDDSWRERHWRWVASSRPPGPTRVPSGDALVRPAEELRPEGNDDAVLRWNTVRES
jgi:hypothetical protein